MKVAWIGLGAMGNPMARYLSKHPHIELSLYNRTQSKTEAWLQQNQGTLAQSAKMAATDAAYVFSCIGNDDDLVEITSSDSGAFHSMKKGSVFIDHSTTSATIAKTQAQLAKQHGIEFLDAPVTGGQTGAENGQLSIMVGGERNALEKATPLINSYAKSIRYMGGSGKGQQTKMVNQIAIAGIVQGLSEAINFAQKADLDIDQVLIAISKGAAQSWQMENAAKNMADRVFDHGFAVNWYHKDLNICLEEAASLGAPLPLARLVESFLEELQTMNEGRSDITSLIKRL